MALLDDTTSDCYDPADPQADPYTFTPSVPPGHFIADYIAYGAARTDAAHDFHEAIALLLLAAATVGVKTQMSHGGLGSNLYLLFVGPSTTSRRSTSAGYGIDLLRDVIPDSLMPDLTTPEAFLEQLAHRSGRSASWFVDEMTDLIEKLTHAKFMAGLRSGLLWAYDGRDFEYARHSKRGKGGERTADTDWVRSPHLNVCGNATESLFDSLTLKDLTSGFLPRFGVIMPTRKPRRRPFTIAPPMLETSRQHLAAHLSALWTWATSATRTVTFAPGALDHLDAQAAAWERESLDLNERERTMLRRADARLIKLSMLVASGRPESLDRDDLLVTRADVTASLAIATRWRDFARLFAGRVGASEFEREVARCRALLRARRRLPRRVVAQQVHLEKSVLDRVGATLVDRGQIEVEAGKNGGRLDARAPETWVSLEESEA